MTKEKSHNKLSKVVTSHKMINSGFVFAAYKNNKHLIWSTDKKGTYEVWFPVINKTF